MNPPPAEDKALVDVVLKAGQLLRPASVPGSNWVHVSQGRVKAVGAGTPPTDIPCLDLGEAAVIAPGFVDMHVHGGNGHTMTSDDPDEINAATSFHLHHGTTSTVVSLITAPIETLQRQLTTIAELTRLGRRPTGHVLGAHLEGPFLSHRRRGVHPIGQLTHPTPAVVDTILTAGAGTIRMLTLAPELPGALGPRGAVRTLCEHGVTVAIGHTDANYHQCQGAFDAGATVATHLFNGMRPLGHRDPGPIAAALDNPTITVELINDGHHVHPPVARLTTSAGAGRVALITDAVAATGAPDGDYTLGGTTIRRQEGRITLVDESSLGGSDLTMANTVQRAVTVLGMPLVDAITAATATPAAALGVPEKAGTIACGRHADLVTLDRNLEVTGVMLGGKWVREPSCSTPFVRKFS